MILVDIEVPVLGKTWDFLLDETVILGTAIIQIREMICLQEQRLFCGKETSLTLWDTEQRKRLPSNRTGAACGLKAGCHLLLV